jgi:hypothetical protein
MQPYHRLFSRPAMPPVIITVPIMPASAGDNDDVRSGAQHPAARHPKPGRSAPRPVTVGPDIIRAGSFRDDFDLRSGLSRRRRGHVSAVRCSNDYRLLPWRIRLKIRADFYSRLIPRNRANDVPAGRGISHSRIGRRKRAGRVGLLNNPGRGNDRARRRSGRRRRNRTHFGVLGRFRAPGHQQSRACKCQNPRIPTYHPQEI